MKISYRTHPVLKMIESKKINNINIYECDKIEYLKNINKINTEWMSLVKKDIIIYKISSPFLESFTKHGNKITEAYLYSEVRNQKIAFLFSFNYAFILDIQNNKESKKMYIKNFIINNNSYLLSAGEAEISYNDIAGKTISCDLSGFHSNNGRLLNDPNKKRQTIFALVNLIIFIKYAKVETKFLPAKKRVKDINCKYVNDTNSNITYLDSTWFTTLVKSDAFKVRGHFRLQPKKHNGKWTRELIWINEFQKEGYTAPARKLQHG